MGRFNLKPPAPEKGRVCLFVNPDTYRMLKAQCVMDGTNVSRWFDEQAKKHLALRAMGFTEPEKPKRKRAPKPYCLDGR
jgi:hypothetical protein